MTQLSSHFQDEPRWVPQIIEDFVFETPAVLHEGSWTLTIERGHAWVFCNRGNFTLNPGESATFQPADGAITIRRLYIRGLVRFHAQRSP
jgi:hypothetical protein